MTIQQQTVFAIGAGYTAQMLASLLDRERWRMIGTTRRAEGIDRLSALGIDGVLFSEGNTPHPPAGAHWVVSTPPDDRGCPAYRTLGACARDAASVTYLSTTGVYGDLSGGWAFEWTPPAPSSRRGERRVMAENQWLELRSDTRIVRLPGIYGPGRSPIGRVRNGSAKRIVKPGQVFSRVHVDDLARGLIALFASPTLTGVFHLCDEEPAPPQDVTAFAAGLVGAPSPPLVNWEAAELSEMARSFYSECKRVSNGRAKAVLQWEPAFPTYREGLRSILSAETL